MTVFAVRARVRAMDFTGRIAMYRSEIDSDIAEYCHDLLESVRMTYGVRGHEATVAFASILRRGGKRIRGSLVLAAYELLGGADRKVVRRVALATEIIHAYLLVIDDVIDRSPLRRGGPTAHCQLQQVHREGRLRGDAGRFGDAMATMAGLMGMSLAELVIHETPLPAERKLQLIASLHGNLVRTAYGQMYDIWNEALQEAGEADARQVAELKTAYYTFVNPLEMGALLADADHALLALLRRFGAKVGVAFQIADDIIGIFSSSCDSGKSSMDDLKEGKMTVLTTRALRQCTPSDRMFLRNMLGNASLTADEFAECRRIIRESGALAYAEKLADEYAQAALKELKSPLVPTALHDFLRELVGFAVAHRS